MTKTTARKLVEILNNFQNKMTEDEISWVLMQIVKNASLDKVRDM